MCTGAVAAAFARRVVPKLAAAVCNNVRTWLCLLDRPALQRGSDGDGQMTAVLTSIVIQHGHRTPDFRNVLCPEGSGRFFRPGEKTLPPDGRPAACVPQLTGQVQPNDILVNRLVKCEVRRAYAKCRTDD